MKIYLLSQDEYSGYDSYDAVVVCADSEEDAKKIMPNGSEFVEGRGNYGTWATKLSSIQCDEIGEANKDQKRGVILASFNAG